MENIPFRGSAPAITAVIGGHVDLSFTGGGTLGTHLDKIKILCNFGKERSEFFPNVPTALEQGYNIIHDNTDGILAPPRLPKEIANLLIAAFTKIQNKPEVKASIKKFEGTPSYLSGEEYHRELIQAFKTYERYKSFFKE